jgi:glycosyltransferase involved in cell wall biosynthesis
MACRVSIVIAAHNAEATLGRSIRSVLEQKLECELLVVDDGSEDATAVVAHSYGARVKLIQQPNAGPGAARNRGIREATGRLVGFLDSDDELLPDMTQVLCKALDETPCAYAASGAHIYQLGATGSIQPPPDALRRFDRRPVPDFFECYRKHRLVCTGAVLVRREVFAEVGAFREDLRFGEDIDLWTRIAGRGPWIFVNTPVMVYHHSHLTSATLRVPENLKPVHFLLSESEMRTAIATKHWGSYRKFRRDRAVRQARLALYQGARAQAQGLLRAIEPAPHSVERVTTEILAALPSLVAKTLLIARRGMARRGRVSHWLNRCLRRQVAVPKDGAQPRASGTDP